MHRIDGYAEVSMALGDAIFRSIPAVIRVVIV